MAKKNDYNEQSITSLKGADRVRLRPAVIFGSDGLEGCEHSFFEILSNSIDESREGYGSRINITVFRDHSITVAACRSIGTKKSSAITGSSYFANCTPAASIRISKAARTNILWG